ncbi:DUF4859 domain-containing protein [Dysgonomonas sp. Marseille-P4677]|uniref:DUF4859 domain-containing protein n=1 Tax=Dysgonomonas sp. Marseille-P4677 TaxID=2364790 RepID=UPI0019131B38|nr:DUF4859 domain-containing protein [Dysgonomonas sp. Marseille-P4677]MBK5720115.1 DUF4859 domain-containing protein [Dysgonomonas sp. Marseille-P4677]
MKKYLIYLLSSWFIIFNIGCTDYDDFTKKHVYGDQNVYGDKKIYIPIDLKDNNFDDDNSKWSYKRSRQSENFICFWEEKFGDDPTYAKPQYAVNINDLLAKVESFYDVYTNKMKFITPGQSKTDKYKMMIFLNYDTEWLATGSGYDDEIGALWINIPAAQPVNETMAHEVGHSFQYQVYADDAAKKSGFRYGFGIDGAGGNPFWEQTAQWQSFKIYKQEQFTSSYFNEYLKYCNLNVLHETPRYSNYFIHDYWVDKHGLEIISKIWRQSQYPEDPIEAYQRITGVNQKIFNDEFFDYARRMVTWDLESIREYGKNYLTRPQPSMEEIEDGFWQISEENCPENYGYNVINLNVPDGGTTVSANFEGLIGANGYRSIKVEKAGWRYGFVALLEDGSTVYSDTYDENNGTVTFNCPDKCKKLCFVVSGAPTEHWRHEWDNDTSNDEQWPYKVRFNATNLYGKISIDPNADPKDITLTYDVAMAAATIDYDYISVEVDINRLCGAFVLYPDQISSKIDKKEIEYSAIKPSGELDSTPATANYPGHWFDGSGNVCSWGDKARFFSEYDSANFVFNIGQYPGKNKSGDRTTIKQSFIYTNNEGKRAQATFIFNVTIQ